MHLLSNQPTHPPLISTALITALGVLVADQAAVHLAARGVLQRALGLGRDAGGNIGRAAGRHVARRQARNTPLPDLSFDLI